MTLGLFDVLDTISSTGNDVSDDEEFNKAYVTFQINRGLAQHNDTIMFAQEMNKNPHLDKYLQYKFLLHGVPKRKRFGKWAKKTNNEETTVLNVMDYFEVNEEKAEKYLLILTPEQIKVINDSFYKGGSTKK